MEIIKYIKDVNSEYDNKANNLHKGKNFAKLYATYRPSYPQEIYDQIMAYHLENPLNERQLAVDVGCGTGISTLPLMKYFDKVIGTDVSEDMISHVPKDIPNLESQVSFAEDLKFLKDDTVDLVTVGTALHWIDEKRFFSEGKRILKPGGTLAVYGIGDVYLENPEAEAYVFKHRATTFAKYCTKKVVAEFPKFESSSFPFNDVRRHDRIINSEERTVDDYIGYMCSIYLTNLYLLENPGTNILEEIKENLEKIYRKTQPTEDQVKIKIVWELFIILGKN